MLARGGTSVATFLMTWNAAKWPWRELRADVDRHRRGEAISERSWSSGTTKRIVSGDRIFFVRLGAHPRALFAAGVATSAPRATPHYDPDRREAGETFLSVDFELDTLLDPEIDDLLDVGRLPSMNWMPAASGTEIRPDIAAEVESLWAAHITRNDGRGSASVARATVEALLADARARRETLKLLATTLRQAHSICPSKWAVSLFSNLIRVNVGMVHVFNLFHDGVWILCAGEIPESDRDRVDLPHSYVKGRAVLVRLDPRDPAKAYERLAAAHREGIVAAATTSFMAPVKGAHSAGLLKFLRHEGLDVSIPAWATTLDDEDDDAVAIEGELFYQFAAHRRRERSFRDRKIEDALHHGPLRCEVPGCGFDFAATYGSRGAGFAEVHHRVPLGESDEARETRLDDLAIVCANCHRMLHRGNACRVEELEVLRVPFP
jgi:HNH endonuclease